MAERNYHPYIIFHVTHHKINRNPNQRDFTTRGQYAMFYMGDQQQIATNFIPEVAQVFGIQIDVAADANIPNPNQKGAVITFRDSTPGGKFPTHNKAIRINPNSSYSIRFDMGNDEFVVVQAGLYRIAEEHCNASQEDCLKFLDNFCSMKPLVEKYEYILKRGSQFDRIDFENLHKDKIGMYRDYYRQVGAMGFNPSESEQEFNEMV